MTISQQTAGQIAFHFAHKKQTEVVWWVKHVIELAQWSTCNQSPRLDSHCSTQGHCSTSPWLVTQTAQSSGLRKPSSNLVIYLFAGCWFNFTNIYHKILAKTPVYSLYRMTYRELLTFLFDNLAVLISKLVSIYFLRDTCYHWTGSMPCFHLFV